MKIKEMLEVLFTYYTGPKPDKIWESNLENKTINDYSNELEKMKLTHALENCLKKHNSITSPYMNNFPIFHYSWYRLLNKEYKKMYVSQVLLGNFDSSIYLSHLCNDNNLTTEDHKFFKILVEYKYKVSRYIAPDYDLKKKQSKPDLISSNKKKNKILSERERELIFFCFKEIAHVSSKYSPLYQFFCHNSTEEQEQKEALYRLVKKIIRPLGEKFEDLINNWVYDNKDILTPTLLDKIKIVIDWPEQKDQCKL